MKGRRHSLTPLLFGMALAVAGVPGFVASAPTTA